MGISASLTKTTVCVEIGGLALVILGGVVTLVSVRVRDGVINMVVRRVMLVVLGQCRVLILPVMAPVVKQHRLGMVVLQDLAYCVTMTSV